MEPHGLAFALIFIAVAIAGEVFFPDKEVPFTECDAEMNCVKKYVVIKRDKYGNLTNETVSALSGTTEGDDTEETTDENDSP